MLRSNGNTNTMDYSSPFKLVCFGKFCIFLTDSLTETSLTKTQISVQLHFHFIGEKVNKHGGGAKIT